MNYVYMHICVITYGDTAAERPHMPGVLVAVSADLQSAKIQGRNPRFAVSLAYSSEAVTSFFSGLVEGGGEAAALVASTPLLREGAHNLRLSQTLGWKPPDS